MNSCSLRPLPPYTPEGTKEFGTPPPPPPRPGCAQTYSNPLKPRKIADVWAQARVVVEMPEAWLFKS